jgi:radical SAM protein with 4Fe4S-binding SPASM domain
MSEKGDKNKQLSPTVCLLPVSSIAIHATGKMIRCHMSETEMGDVNNGSIIKQWDNNAFQDLRKKQRDGEWTRGCSNCEGKEARGVTSKRVHWQSLGIVEDRWEDIDWDNNLTGNKLVHLDIAFNNLCNFKCKMCSSAYSNAWIGDEEKLKAKGIAPGSAGSAYTRPSNSFNRTKHSLSTEQLQELVDNGKDLRRIEILGGEPFLVPQFMEFLAMLRNAGLDKQIELMITTNGSVVTEKHLEALEGFKYVNINLSLDASGELFSYIRSAGIIDWAGITEKAELIKNWCDKPREGQYKLNLNGTFMSLNALNIKEFIEWIIKFYGWDKKAPSTSSKFRHSFEHRILFGPKSLHVQWLSKKTLSMCLEQINYLLDTYDFFRFSPINETRYITDIKKLVEGLILTDDIDRDYSKFGPAEFARYITELDIVRNESLKEVAPEVFADFEEEIDKYNRSKNVNMCYMPWHGLAVAANGNIKPCCQWEGNLGKVGEQDIVETFKTHPKILKLRSDFLTGKQPESCKSCWTREKQIGESRRKWFSSKFMDSIPKDYNYEPTIDNLLWTQMDINLSNVCNLKCRMCGSWASNSWFEEDILLSKINPKFEKESDPEKQTIRQHSLEDLQSLLPYLSKLTRIDFKGGEPMMAKNHVEFLEMLIAEGLNEKLTLQYTTNGTIVNPKILDVLAKFKKVRVMFSIEGTGSLYKYIRGGKYDIEQMESTLAMYNALDNVDIGFNVTIQAYNLLNLKELYDLLASWSHKYEHVSNTSAFNTICNSPMYLSPFVLPQSLRLAARTELEGINDFKKLCENLGSGNVYTEHWDTFKEFTVELDKIRGESVSDVVPQLKDFFK